jgi:hypothetical protein
VERAIPGAIKFGHGPNLQVSFDFSNLIVSKYLLESCQYCIAQLHEALCFYSQRGTSEYCSTSHRLFLPICLMYYYSLQIKNGIKKNVWKPPSFFFFENPIYLQSVVVHSANGW